ncbi:MAG: DUF434 domain-containing protein [Sediminispirochaetaceae bacterium]
MHGILEGNSFTTAVREYFWLLNRGYPEKRSRLLVADHYGLNRYQRTALYRGVFPDTVNRRRTARILAPEETDGKTVAVDLLNQILLIVNYLYGRNVFIATDRFVRDDGENFSSFDNRGFYLEALRIMGGALQSLGFSRRIFCIDSSCGALYPELMTEGTAAVEVIEPVSADRYLIETPEVTVATSDSVVLDRCNKKVFDLAGYALARRFSPDLPDLHAIVY